MNRKCGRVDPELAGRALSASLDSVLLKCPIKEIGAALDLDLESSRKNRRWAQVRGLFLSSSESPDG